MSVSVLVVLVSVLVMFLLGSTANAQTRKTFIYDKKENVETVFTLDETGKYLTPKIKYEYGKDKAGVVVEKVAFRWDEKSVAWKPYYRMQFSKGSSDKVVEYALWSKEAGAFSSNKQKAVYNLSAGDELVAYHSYQWNSEESDWNLCQQVVFQNYLAIHIGE